MKFVIIYYLIGVLVSLFFMWIYRWSGLVRKSKPKKTDCLGGLIGPWVWPLQIILGFYQFCKWFGECGMAP